MICFGANHHRALRRAVAEQGPSGSGLCFAAAYFKRCAGGRSAPTIITLCYVVYFLLVWAAISGADENISRRRRSVLDCR